MSLVIADSRPESLTLIAAQHEDWIIQQAITLLENRVYIGSFDLSTTVNMDDITSGPAEEIYDLRK